MIKCDHNHCDNEVFKRAVFYIYADTDNDHSPIISSLPIYCCNTHATKKNADDLLINNKKGRKQIEKTFAHQGLRKPCWKKSYAEWKIL